LLLLGYFETMKCLEKYNLPLQTENKGNTPRFTIWHALYHFSV